MLSTEVTKDPEYADTLKGMAKLRKKMLFCDIVLTVNGVEFSAHKLVLSVRSAYFEAMFCRGFPEQHQKAVDISGFNPTVFEMVLNYMYTGDVKISVETAPDALKIADYLQLHWLRRRCHKFILKNLCVDNCIEFWKLAGLYCTTRVENEALEFVRVHINETSKTENFLSLDFKDVNYLLSYVQETERHAKACFNAIINWIQYDEEERSQCLADLLDCIKPMFLCKSNEFDEKLLLFKNAAVDKDFRLKRFYENSTADELAYVAAELRRNFDEFGKHLFILSGPSQALSFNAMTACVNNLPPRPASEGCCAIAYKGGVYLMGGERKRTALRYDLTHDIWESFPFRCTLEKTGACVVNDSVYFTGGYIAPHSSDKVMSYNFNRAMMISQTRMMLKRRSHGSTSHENCVYVCGGLADINKSPCMLANCERMDVREGKWFRLRNMLNFSGPVTAAMTDKVLYCKDSLSGYTECYDLRACSWHQVLARNPDRFAGEIAVYEGILYQVCRTGVYLYCDESDSWIPESTYPFDIPSVVSLDNAIE